MGKLANRQLLPLAAFVSLTALIAAGGYASVRHATNDLLEAEARNDAVNWANYLSINIPDLPRIADGSSPSLETRRFLERAKRVGRVTAFRVYDTKGYLRLRSGNSDRPLTALQTMAVIDPEHVQVLQGREPQTNVHRGTGIGEPAYYVSTVIPVTDKGRTLGWIVANIDQTDRQANFFAMASTVSLSVGSMLMLAPLIGFLYRTRQKRNAELQLQDLARRDMLTGLDNRATFLDLLHASFADAAAPKSALVVLEVTDLAQVSQNFGPSAAEQLVISAAERLRKHAPAGSNLSRLDGARFGVLFNTISDPMDILAATKDLVARLSAPVQWAEIELPAQAFAGIALSKSDGSDAPSLLRSAELALRATMDQGSPSYGFFNPEIAQDARRRVAVQRAVAEATANNSFRLDFQPIYNIRNGELSGFEALIRLNDPELGPISPAEFIPIAEQAGHITKIGAWCLQEACRIAAEWPAHLVVSVNLSPAQFYAGTLISDVQHALQAHRLPSYRLEVEITEGTMLKESELVLQQLRILREAGVAVALDDFGTGYSSLSYLWKFPFSKLKIDRSFVSALDETSSARGILRSIVKLGHGLGLTVTAEGIENSKQFATLRELGCDLAQGYLLDRPARVEDLAAIILRNFAKGLRRSRESEAGEDNVIPLHGSQAAS